MQSFGEDISDKTSTLNNAIDYKIKQKKTLRNKIIKKKKKKLEKNLLLSVQKSFLKALLIFLKVEYL